MMRGDVAPAEHRLGITCLEVGMRIGKPEGLFHRMLPQCEPRFRMLENRLSEIGIADKLIEAAHAGGGQRHASPVPVCALIHKNALPVQPAEGTCCRTA